MDGIDARAHAFTLVLPYPVSANRYWRTVVNRRTGNAMTFVSEEAKAFKSQTGWIAKQAGIRTPLGCLVELHVRLIPKNRVCMDLDNALKVTIDALKGVCFDDDSQVYRLVAERCEPQPDARCEVTISQFVPAPAELFAA